MWHYDNWNNPDTEVTKCWFKGILTYNMISYTDILSESMVLYDSKKKKKKERNYIKEKGKNEVFFKREENIHYIFKRCVRRN